MKHNTGKTAWICGAAAVAIAAAGWWRAAADMQAGPGDKAGGEADDKAVRRNDITEPVVGTYGENVYVYEFDGRSLEFTLKGSAEAKNASYALAKGEHLYTVSETGPSSGTASFRKDDKGSIRRESEPNRSGEGNVYTTHIQWQRTCKGKTGFLPYPHAGNPPSQGTGLYSRM